MGELWRATPPNRHKSPDPRVAAASRRWFVGSAGFPFPNFRVPSSEFRVRQRLPPSRPQFHGYRVQAWPPQIRASVLDCVRLAAAFSETVIQKQPPNKPNAQKSRTRWGSAEPSPSLLRSQLPRSEFPVPRSVGPFPQIRIPHCLHSCFSFVSSCLCVRFLLSAFPISALQFGGSAFRIGEVPTSAFRVPRSAFRVPSSAFRAPSSDRPPIRNPQSTIRIGEGLQSGKARPQN
jgi:hypothetical protein